MVLILTVPFGIVGIVGLAQGQMGGIALLLYGAAGIALSVRFFQTRVVLSPKEFVAHNILRVRRAELSDVAAVDIADWGAGDTRGRVPRVRLKNGIEFWVWGLAITDVETVRQILHVGGEGLGMAIRRGKRKEQLDG
jgi:hypothetical protein